MIPRPVLSSLEPYVPGARTPGGIKLSSNENPLGPSPLALQAMLGALSAGGDELNRYPDGEMPQLKAALAAHTGFDTDSIVVGNGSDEIMVMIAGAFIEPGTNAITSQHTFSQYTFAARIFGGEVRTAPMVDGTFDLDRIAELIDADTRLVFICNPNNPTATYVGRQPFERFLDSVPDHVVVVVDEAYGEFADANDYPDTLSLVRRTPNLIRLRTFSKIYGLAALRVGYAIAQQELISHVTALRQPFNVGTIAQIAATAALEDDAFVRRSLSTNRAGRDLLVDYLTSRSIVHYPSQANFVCAEFGSSAARIHQELRERGVSVRPLTSFGLPDHLRVSVGTPAEMDEFYRSLDDVLAKQATRSGCSR